jgi:3-methyl-2-oxobutanoate hydroxymethyltransferase
MSSSVKKAANSASEARPYEPEKNPAIRRLTAGAIKRRKGKAIFPVATAYDAPFGNFVEAAGIDVILVGDSVGNVVLGYDETTPVTLDQMVHHAQAVVRGTSRAHVIVDMPFGSYQVSNEDALRSAIRCIKEGGGSSVKLEGHRSFRHSRRRTHRRNAANRRARSRIQTPHAPRSTHR